MPIDENHPNSDNKLDSQDPPPSPDSARSRPRLVRDRLQGKVFLIPSLVTVVGIFCGFLAILHAFKGNFESATKYIALSFIFDILDGRIARRLNATSAFGREFDSLSDVVAFGVAPAALVYSWGFGRVADEFGMLVSFSLVVCGAMRLARFNIDTESRKYFVGLPIPGAAAAIAAAVYYHPEPLTSVYSTGLMIAYTLTIACLMVSPTPYPSLKKLKLTRGNMRINLLVISALVALIWYHSKLMILILIFLYVVSGPLFAVANRIAPRKSEVLRKFGVP